MEKWIDWPGGECPVEDNTPVKVLLRSGDSFRTVRPLTFHRWNHEGNEADIIGYRVITNPYVS